MCKPQSWRCRHAGDDVLDVKSSHKRVCLAAMPLAVHDKNDKKDTMSRTAGQERTHRQALSWMGLGRMVLSSCKQAWRWDTVKRSTNSSMKRVKSPKYLGSQARMRRDKGEDNS
jgi:hypothetical protein